MPATLRANSIGALRADSPSMMASTMPASHAPALAEIGSPKAHTSSPP